MGFGSTLRRSLQFVGKVDPRGNAVSRINIRIGCLPQMDALEELRSLILVEDLVEHALDEAVEVRRDRRLPGHPAIVTEMAP
jgi:hypothetical protein